MTRTSVPRLHSVRFKDGRAPIRVYRSGQTVEADQMRQRFAMATDEVIAYRRNMAGYAIVAWGADGSTSVVVRTAGSPVPLLMVPEFVKTCVADWIHTKDPE
jgi:hypothetical protein